MTDLHPAVLALVRRSCAASGVPEKVEDQEVIDQLAAIFQQARRERGVC